MRIPSIVIASAALCFLSGCGPSYYRVTDPTTGRSYYTTGIEEQRNGGLRLRDAATGNTVTLQNSEIQKVNKEQFESGKVRQTPSVAPTVP